MLIICVKSLIGKICEIAAEKSGLADGGQAFAGNLNMNLGGKKIALCKKNHNRVFVIINCWVWQRGKHNKNITILNEKYGR